MSTDKKHFTLVYEYTPEFMNHNPFKVETPWGSAIGSSIGDELHVAMIYEEALEEIRNGSSDAEQIAEKALDDIDEYRRGQDWRNPMAKR